MTKRKASYLPRIVDEKIKKYLDVFSALSIEGPIWCGKTWASLNHAVSANYIMEAALAPWPKLAPALPPSQSGEATWQFRFPWPRSFEVRIDSREP